MPCSGFQLSHVTILALPACLLLPSQDGHTPLWLAVRRDHAAVVRELMTAGVMKDARGQVRGIQTKAPFG